MSVQGLGVVGLLGCRVSDALWSLVPIRQEGQLSSKPQNEVNPKAPSPQTQTPPIGAGVITDRIPLFPYIIRL